MLHLLGQILSVH